MLLGIIMDKQFLIILASVVIIGFSASAYIFSQGSISLEFDGVADNLAGKKAQVIDEINKCISQNSVSGGSITLNSFERNLLSNTIMQVENAENSEALDNISDQIYTMTSCKRE
tara:strand:+ start:368 stop:709 length:342 start_codon:yes stop_codon:yes gene_type:complete